MEKQKKYYEARKEEINRKRREQYQGNTKSNTKHGNTKGNTKVCENVIKTVDDVDSEIQRLLKRQAKQCPMGKDGKRLPYFGDGAWKRAGKNDMWVVSGVKINSDRNHIGGKFVNGHYSYDVRDSCGKS